MIVHRDMSKWIFRPHSVDSNNRQVYRLANIVDRAGNFVTLVWDAEGRLDNITRGDGYRLMKCRYSGANLQAVEAYDANNTIYAQVHFDYQNGLLSGVSQITNGSSVPLRWGYQYRTIGNTPLIMSVGTQDPSAGKAANQLAWHTIAYDGQGIVAMMVDANGHARTYTYNGGTTTVKVYNQATGQEDFQWTQQIGAKNVNAGIQDAEQHSSTVAYQYDYLPATYTNRNGQTTQFVYDIYGNVVEVISPRGIRTVYTYDYPPDYPCSPIRQVMVTEYGSDNSLKLPTRYVFYQQTGPVQGVVGGYAIAGFLAQVIEPKPGLSGGDPYDPNNFVVTNYYYTQFGSLLEVRSPAPSDTPGDYRTTRYFYGTDPYLGYPDPEGERIDMPIAMGVYEGAYNPNQPFAGLLYRESWRYDGRGNVVSVIRGRRGDTASASHYTTQLEYNLAGQVVRVIFPADNDQFQAIHLYKYRYPGGQLVQIETNEGRVISTLRGKEGEYTAVTQGVQKQSYTYDAQYRRTGLTNGLGHTTNYSYTPAGFFSSLAYPTSFGNPNSRDTFRYEYDPEGNLTMRFDPNAPRTPAFQLVRSSVDSRVELIDYAGETPDVIVAYDSFNRVIGLQSSVATITYTYDDGDRLVSTTTQYPGLPPLTVRYGYYPDGSRAWMEAPYALDTNDSILTGTYVYRYQHYPSETGGFALGPGELVEVQTPWVVTPIRTYFSTDGVFYRQDTSLLRTQATLHPRGLISSLTNYAKYSPYSPRSETIISSFSTIGYTSGGEIRRINSIRLSDLNLNINPPNPPVLAGRLQFEFAEGRTSLVTREIFTATDGNTLSYTLGFLFDDADNPLWSGQFNANNQIVNANTVYDASGNALTWFGRPVTYDTANRLIGFGANLPHNIRPDGLRAFKQGNQGPKYFVYDGDVVIFEYEPANRTFRAYAYGANGLAMSLGVAPGQGRSIYSVYAYDPFGRRVNRIDADDFEWGFLGQAVAWYDAYGEVAFDFSPRSGGSYARDSVGYLGQWGYYTDVETAPDGSILTWLYVDASYYDPARGLKLNRSSRGSNPYTGLRLQGDSLAHLCWNTVVGTAEAGYLSADPSAPEGLAFFKALEASAGVALIAGAIEGYASLPRMLGGLGAGIIGAADDLAGGGVRLAGRAGRSAVAVKETSEKLRGGVYVLRHPDTGQVMRVGRTMNLERRRVEHRRHPEIGQYNFEVVYQTDVYAQQRGLEQILHDICKPPLDKINPISPKNPRRQLYLQAAEEFLRGRR